MLGRLVPALAALAIVLLPLRALADGTIGVTYYMLPEHHPDVSHGIDDRTITGLVAQRLGPHGLPVATTFGRRVGGPASGPIHDLNSDGEILWWSTASKNGVRIDKSGHEKLPLLLTSMFPSGHSNDTNGYRTAHFRGTFEASSKSTVGMQLGSDDDAWVFVDGILRVDNGGVKAMTYTPYSLGHLAPGRHVMDIFYADRYGSGAAIEIDTPATLAPAAFSAPPPRAAHAARPSLTAAQMRLQLRTTGSFTLRDIHFGFNRTDITPDSAAVLAEVGKLLHDEPGLRLRVEGHTDGAGDAAYNQDLSERRAAAVKTFLVAHSRVAPGRLETAGFGSSRPVATNATAKGRLLNRRVVFSKR